MNLDDIVKENSEREKIDREIQSIREDVKKSYKKLLNLLEDKDLKIKYEITHKCRKDIKEYFLNKGFSISSKNEKGVEFLSNKTTYYSKENTYIRVSVIQDEATSNFIIIDIFKLNEETPIASLAFTFKLDKDSEERSNYKYPIKIGNEYVYVHNYSNLIEACTNKEQLLELKETISKNIDYIKSNIDKNIPLTYVYEEKKVNLFKTFEEAFEKTLANK